MMHGNKINYDNLDIKLLECVPEFEDIYTERTDVSDNGKLKHIVLMGFIDYLEENNNKLNGELLEKIKGFIDMLVNSNDKLVIDLLFSELFEFIEDNSFYKILLSDTSSKLYYKHFK